MPVLGTDFYEVKADLQTAQAVVPGQGQSVNVAGVKVGEVGDVKLENGHAVVTMQIQDKYKPIYHDATVLMRPKTGLKDMYLALDPGTKQAGALPEGGHVTVQNTLPDVNADEVLAQLDTDTRAYLEILLSAGGTAFDDHATGADKRFQQTAEQDLREVFKRFEPTARYGDEITSQLIARRAQHHARDPQLPAAARPRWASATTSSPASSTPPTRTSRRSPPRSRPCARRCASSPARCRRRRPRSARPRSWPAQLGPALQRLRPFARELAPALRKTRPFLRETTPIIQKQIRPFARDVPADRARPPQGHRRSSRRPRRG